MARLIEWTGDRFCEDEVASKPMAKLPAPGPYTIETYRDGVDDCWAVMDRNRETVSYYGFWDECDGKSEQIESNLKLLSEAPELLYALICLSEECARLPWSFFDGTFFKALRLGQSIVVRLFGSHGEPMYSQWKNEFKAQLAGRSESKARGQK